MARKIVTNGKIISEDFGLVGLITQSPTYPFEKVTWWPPVNQGPPSHEKPKTSSSPEEPKG